jgi:sterol desaturase/sphingolipid hydroxylase (fatty acid hydroxylase superfamily)
MVVVAVLLAILGTFLYGTLAGWVAHWVVHQRWAGRLYRSHMNHHLKQYPPNDLLSEKYRWAGKDDTTIIFIPPITLFFLLYGALLWQLGVPWIVFPVILVEAILVGALHDWIHIASHIQCHWLLRYRWFQRLRALHFIHHAGDMRKNMGIIWFGWDRVFGTYRP